MRLLASFSAFAVLAFADPAHAQPAGVMDQIINQFRTQSAGWQGTLRAFALNTFYILAVIELAWSLARLALSRADFSEWMAELLNQIMFLGFFLLMLLNSVTWGTAIIGSFRFAAQSAGGTGVSPTDVFLSGVTVAEVVFAQMSIWNPAASGGLMIAGIVIIVAFALIVAEMIMTLVESTLIISMGVIFMAFGGSRWTKDIAVNTLRYTVSVGAKLFVLQLLVSIGSGFIDTWVAGFQTVTAQTIAVMIGSVTVLLALVKTLPAAIQGMINGHPSGSSGGALIGAAAAVGGGVAAATAVAVGAPAAAAQAARLASSQLGAQEAAGAPRLGGIERAASLIGGTGKNLASAAASDVGRRLAGTGSIRGSAPWRMAADMGNQRRLLSDDATAPRPSAAGGASGSGGGTLSVAASPSAALSSGVSPAAGPAPAARGAAAAASSRPEPWMTQSGGFDGMSSEHQASAERSYARWAEDNPELGARHDLHDYVFYVQGKEAERMEAAAGNTNNTASRAP